MDTLRKGFYVLDLLVLTILMVCIIHTVVYDNEWGFLILDAALLLRFNSTFLLYRKEKMSFLPIVAFTLLFGFAVLSGTFENSIVRMSEYPSIVLNHQPTVEEHICQRYVAMEMLVKCVIYWAWLMPIVAYAVLTISQRLKKNEYRWYDLIGFAVFKDSAGKLFVTTCTLAFIAMLIGYQMDEILSFYAMMTLPLVAFYCLNRYVGRNVNWLEYVILAIGLYVYDKAQYQVDDERIAYLLVSAVVVMAVCMWMMIKTKKVVAALFASVLMSIVLPGLSIGYNIYQSMEGVRSVNYVSPGMKKGYMYIRRMENVNGKQKMMVGIRDRYRTTIPCKFTIIVPDGLYSPFALCMTEKRDSVYYNVERGYVFEKHSREGQRQ